MAVIAKVPCNRPARVAARSWEREPRLAANSDTPYTAASANISSESEISAVDSTSHPAANSVTNITALIARTVRRIDFGVSVAIHTPWRVATAGLGVRPNGQGSSGGRLAGRLRRRRSGPLNAHNTLSALGCIDGARPPTARAW